MLIDADSVAMREPEYRRDPVRVDKLADAGADAGSGSPPASGAGTGEPLFRRYINRAKRLAVRNTEPL